MRCFGSCVLAVLLVLGACGGDDAPADPGDAAPPTPDASAGDPLLDPPPAGQGFQLRMTTTIPPGVEGEWCKLVMGPPEDVYLNRDQVRFAAGSHHFLLYQTSYTSIPTTNEDGVAVDTSGVFDCSEGATAGWNVVKLLGGSQNGDGASITGFPPDVAMKLPASTVLLMNAHYINTSDEPITPEVAINLWTVPPAQVRVEGDILFLYNPFIKVPAGGTARARWRCPVHADITIGNVQSHMHKRGTGYAAMVGGQAPFYENTQWEDVPVKVFEPGLQVKAGATLDYYCDYTNPENREVVQGPRTTDEMCMLIGAYWPADPRTSYCLDEAGHLGGEWVGNGTASCAQTWGCIAGSFGGAGSLGRLAGCIDQADPAVAAEMSAALRCLIATRDPAKCGTPIEACKAK